MGNAILILGESGSGKSTSIRNLPPEETFILNVIGKPLPFKGSKKNFVKLSEDGKTGNYYASDNPMMIMRVINLVNEHRPEIKNLIIDDFGYVITNAFMRKAMQKGYEKFAEIGSHTFIVLDAIQNLRDDLFCFLMMHTEIDAHGQYKPKTIGKMIDQHIVIEGKFTYVLHALTSEGEYRFLTNHDGQHMAKTPLGLFEDALFPNDLLLVKQQIESYFNEE